MNHISNARPGQEGQRTGADEGYNVAQGAMVSTITVHQIAPEETGAIGTAVKKVGKEFSEAAPRDQVDIARQLASHAQFYAPDLVAKIDNALDFAPVALFDGMPVGDIGDEALAAMLSMMRGGEIFQYTEQLGGKLVAAIEPRKDSAPNSNASTEPFGFHTDDAILLARHRVEEISLLSLLNPVGTTTGFAALKALLLSGATRDILHQPRFSIKAPNAFALGDEYWIDGVPILTVNARGEEEIAYPSYNTKPTWEGDGEARRALGELDAALEAAVIDLYLAPGQWVVWNNSAVVHRRGAIGVGPRKLLRTYIRRDCDAMREATGVGGPIFSALALLNAENIARKGTTDVD